MKFVCKDCNQLGNTVKPMSETRFAQHLEQEHAYTPHQTGREVQRQERKNLAFEIGKGLNTQK